MTDLELRRDLLHDTGVKVMRAFRQHRALLERIRLGRRIGEGRDVGRRGDGLRRRREVARVARMQGRAIERLVHYVEAWADLIGIDILPHLVEA